MCSHARTGSLCSSSAARQSFSSAPRMYGYFTRSGEYVYQENVAPRGTAARLVLGDLGTV